MEKILRIEECINYNGKDGYLIITDKQTIMVGISNEQCCCENWGYLMSEDNLDDFNGAILISISSVDNELKSNMIEEDLDEGEAMFINFETSAGLLQFVAYNSHNGYYGHSAVCVSKQLNIEEYL